MHSFRVPDLVAILLLLLLAFVTVDRLAPAGSATSPDSLAYLETARNIGNGQGITLVERTFDGAETFQPMTTWPPLYPLALSVVVPTDDALAGPPAAAQLSVALLALLLVTCFLFLRRFWPTTGAALATAAIALSAPVTSVYAYAWSETLLLPLLAGSLLLAVIAASGREQKTAALAFIGLAVLLGFAFATRYASGILGLLLPAVFLLNRKHLHRGASLFAFLLYAGIVGAILARNILLTGMAGGSERRDGIAWLQAVGELGNALALYISSPALWIALLLAALFTILVHRRPPAWPAPERAQAAILLAAVAALASLLALLVLATVARFDSLDQRLLAPSLFALLLAVLAALPVAIARRSPIVMLACASLVALLLVPGLFQFASAPLMWEKKGAPMIARDRNGTYSNFTAKDGRPLLQGALADVAPGATTIYSDRPRLAAFLTTLPARSLPAGVIDADWLQKLANKPDSVLLLVQRPQAFASYSQEQGLSIRHHAELARRGLLLIPLDQSFAPADPLKPSPR